MTRLNVYAGPAGFFIIRGGPAGDGAVLDSRTGLPASLPGPAPRENDKFPPNKPYREIPIAIQDRSFNADGSLFYPDTRAFFDGIAGPYIPDTDISPIWNPEFFGNMIIVNGNTWPFQTVEQRRYRFRVLNGCQSRFLILDFNQIPGVEVWAIGNEGGFLAAPVNLTADNGNRLLMGLAERADLIVDFTNVPLGQPRARQRRTRRTVRRRRPRRRLRRRRPRHDRSDHAVPGGARPRRRRLDPAAVPPTAGHHPAAGGDGDPAAGAARGGCRRSTTAPPRPCSAPSPATRTSPPARPPSACGWTRVTENPAVGATEVWELYNATADAHPMHIHEIHLRSRQPPGHRRATRTSHAGAGRRPDRTPTPPESWETGVKDTVIAYPGQVTRVKAQFDDARPVRVALPHRRTRRQRDDAPLPHRPCPARPARLASAGLAHV